MLVHKIPLRSSDATAVTPIFVTPSLFQEKIAVVTGHPRLGNPPFRILLRRALKIINHVRNLCRIKKIVSNSSLFDLG